MWCMIEKSTQDGYVHKICLIVLSMDGHETTLLTSSPRASFTSLFLRQYMNGFSMGLITVYINEAIILL